MNFILVILILVSFLILYNIQSKYRIINNKIKCQQFLLSEIQKHVGFANKIFNAIINVAISIQTNRCFFSNILLIFSQQFRVLQ